MRRKSGEVRARFAAKIAEPARELAVLQIRGVMIGGCIFMLTKTSARGRARKRPGRASFTALDRFTVRDIGTLVSVELDRDTTGFTHLIGKKIIIDGRIEHCFSIERLTHGGPWKRGERIHLLIRKAKAKRRNTAGSVGPAG
jgi:hypothetical protein